MRSPLWVEAMITVIKRQKWFRWHDAGDVQDLEHLNKIFEICRATPETRHWLPTREAWIKNELERKPKNLVIRFSPPMMGQRVDSWPHSSMVVDKDATCPAPKQGGKCGDCRQCWDPAVKVVSYGKHQCLDTQSIIKNYESYVINRIRPLATKLRRRRQACVLVRASSNKLQATSNKLQAPSESNNKRQASSPKQQASSFKPQAASSRILEPRKSFTVPEPRCWTMINVLVGCFT